MHYTGWLRQNGVVFDSSVSRGDPFSFTLGKGTVIKGWENGLLDMCVGERRRLTIPADLGYGSYGSGVSRLTSLDVTALSSFRCALSQSTRGLAPFV
jgi:FKBP-type peptidyl-prolyl cis-trans isomerase